MIRWGTSTYDPDDETDMYWEHGRRYARDYFMPNDEDEQDRLRILHQIYLNIFNLELTTIPLDDPTAVLDVGTGTGEWSMAMAERWPDCKVTGIDLSPTFERAVPHNCHFEVMDGEDPWPWDDNTFDMVHYRHMSGAFRDWNYVYGQTLRCLKPGGWVEILEFHDHEGEKNFYDRFPPHSLMHKAAKGIEEAEKIHGKHRGIDHMEPDLLEDNGFVDCEVHEHIIPLDPSNSPLGKLWLVTLRAGFESYSLRLLTKYLGWDAASVRMACESVGQQMIAMATNPALNKGFQIRLRVTIARKPLVPEAAHPHPPPPPPPPGSGIGGGEGEQVRPQPGPTLAASLSPPGPAPGTGTVTHEAGGTPQQQQQQQQQHPYPNEAARPRPSS
jgi:SAM-dependent methyltransferase